MAHSVELLLDPEAESAIRGIWAQLSDMGLRSPGPNSRPHVTLVAAERISPDVDASLSGLVGRLPLDCVVGAPMVFGRASLILVRLLVPSAALLDVQDAAHRICAAHASPHIADNTRPGRWTPHVTLARRAGHSELARAMGNATVTREFDACIVGLRRWDGDRRSEHLIG